MRIFTRGGSNGGTRLTLPSVPSPGSIIVYDSVVSNYSSSRGSKISQGGCELIILQNFGQNLHKNERIWTEMEVFIPGTSLGSATEQGGVIFNN